MTTCATCTHALHLRAKDGHSLGWAACSVDYAADKSKFFPAARSCVNGQWRSAPQAPVAARVGDSLEKRVDSRQAISTPADAERAT